jgi:hypothetical protein
VGFRDESFLPPLVRGMGRHSDAAHARSRILDDGEIRRVWKPAGSADVVGAMLKFPLLTAARKGEAGGMTWAEVDGGVWLLPSARNKTAQELARPLSRAVQNSLRCGTDPGPGKRTAGNSAPQKALLCGGSTFSMIIATCTLPRHIHPSYGGVPCHGSRWWALH